MTGSPSENDRRDDVDLGAARIRNVFVLATGRCGTMTFARACEHVSGFTVGHESRASLVGDDRFAYPLDHIEVDNRLSWFLGEVAHRWSEESTLFVHLLRDRDAVVQSFENRWDSPYRANIIRAFGHGIVTRRDDWSPGARREVCEFYVDTVNRNIAEFIRGRQSMILELESLHDQFEPFVERLGATVDVERALAEIATRHNAT